MFGLQHGALAHTEQQAIKGPKITSVKLFKRENQRSNLYKIITRGSKEPVSLTLVYVNIKGSRWIHDKIVFW